MLRAALLLLLAGRRAAAGAGNSAWRVPTAEIAGGDLTKLQYFAGALSPAECATVRGLAPNSTLAFKVVAELRAPASLSAASASEASSAPSAPLTLRDGGVNQTLPE